MPRCTNYKYYSMITGLFVAFLYLANILDIKVINFFGYDLPAGTLLFPMTFLFGDVLTEVYGYAASRRVIWTGFAALALMVGMTMIVQYLPAGKEWHDQVAYDTILGRLPRIALASVIAFFCGEFVNSYIIAKLKVFSNGAKMPVRFILSTFFGQAIDTVVFIIVAFAGIFSIPEMLWMSLGGWAFKVTWEIIALPLSVPFVSWLKRAEAEDYFDRDTNFNPFKIAG